MEENNKIDQLKEYRKKLSELSEEEEKQRNLYLKKLASGKIQGPPTGYPSIDKPWLKYFEEDAITKELPKMTCYDYLKNNNNNSLNRCALNFFGLKISYKKLFKKIDEVAKCLVELGVKKGDIVTINSVTLPQSIYLIYALNKIGAISNLTDVRTDQNGMKHYLNETESKFIFTMDQFYDNISNIINETSVEKVILLNPTDEIPFIGKLINSHNDKKSLSEEEYSNNINHLKRINNIVRENENILDWKSFIKLKKTKKEVLKINYEENLPMAIVHTSGTTNLPKSIVLTNDNFNAMPFQYSVSDFKYARGESLLNIVPIFTAYGVVNSLPMPLCLGMTDIVYPKVVNSDFTSILKRFKPNHVIAIPMHWEFLLKNEDIQNEDLSFLKTAASGGDNMNIEMEKRVNQFLEDHNSPSKIVKGYGMTEVSACAVTNTNHTTELGSVGIPLVKNNIKIIDSDTNIEVINGEKGEICIESPSAMREYYKNEEETKDVLKIHDDGKVWIHSGDLGHMTADGKLYIDGRIKRLIIRRGFKISAIAIENIILKHDAIESCSVVKVPNEIDGEVPFAFIVLKNEYKNQSDVVIDELKQMCNEQLPDYYAPAFYNSIERMPYKSNTGKLDFILLENMAVEIVNSQLDKVKTR